jgi:hypothetical protein
MRGVLAVTLLGLAGGGCASPGLAPSSSAPAPALRAGVPTPDQLALPYRTQAGHLERSGHLRLAVEAWTTALALAPNHEPSRQALKHLRGRIDRVVTEHLRRGWRALAREDAAEARRHFLTALALDPDSRGAQEALRATPAPPGSDFETRTTRSAVRPAVLTGAQPRLQESAPPGANRSGETEATGASATPTPLAEPGGGAAPEAETPGALYAAARAHLAARDHDRAYRALVQLDHVSPGYRDSATLLRALRPRLARQRYQDGLRLFREELLEDAIEQWRAVLEIDPAHRLARRNIEQAEKMLRTLAAQPKR